MRMEDLDYELPADRIAQEPAVEREGARLMHVDRASRRIRHGRIPDLADALVPGDVVVVNDTRVLPARLLGNRVTGGRVELLLIEPTGDAGGSWRAMAHAGGRLTAGETLSFGDAQIVLVDREAPDGLWTVRAVGQTMREVCQHVGVMPLPPYIQRAAGDPRADADRDRYQTVYARHEGAVAAPTAGLHLTPALIDDVRARGVRWAPVTLHVGLGTFQPVRTADLDDHVMHAERYEIPPTTADAVRAARAEGRRIFAIGTTTVRALEASALTSSDGLPTAGAATTDLCIQPGYTFRAVDALLTNFHLPRSTLLALVGAFMGVPQMLEAYRSAIEEGYRFYSYGDAMLIQ